MLFSASAGEVSGQHSFRSRSRPEPRQTSIRSRRKSSQLLCYCFPINSKVHIISCVAADPLRHLPLLLDLQKLLPSLSLHLPSLQNKGRFRSWHFRWILWFLGWSYFVWILFLIWTSVFGILFLESTGRLIISHERQQTSLFKNAGGCKREKMRAALSH